jgi:hypothetical protein
MNQSLRSVSLLSDVRLTVASARLQHTLLKGKVVAYGIVLDGVGCSKRAQRPMKCDYAVARSAGVMRHD